MSLRKVAGLLMAFGLVVGLVGAGVGANFTDSASAVANISVGTFGIAVSAPGGVVTNSGHTVTLTCATIQSSAAGSCPIDFTVTTTGTIPATVTVSSSDGFVAPWSDMFVNPGVQTIVGSGGTYTYHGGIKWTELSNADLNTAHTVTYTISATA